MRLVRVAGRGPQRPTQAISVYGEAMGYLRAADRPGFAAATPAGPVSARSPRSDATGSASRASSLGFGYGYLSAPGQWWHHQVHGALRPRGRRGCGRFELAELHVRPGYRAAGPGRCCSALADGQATVVCCPPPRRQPGPGGSTGRSASSTCSGTFSSPVTSGRSPCSAGDAAAPGCRAAPPPPGGCPGGPDRSGCPGSPDRSGCPWLSGLAGLSGPARLTGPPGPCPPASSAGGAGRPGAGPDRLSAHGGAARDRLTVATVCCSPPRRCRTPRQPRPAGRPALVAVAGGGGLRPRRSARRPATRSAGTPTPTPSGRVLGVPVVIPLAWTMMAWPASLAGGRLARGPPARVALAGVALASWDLFLDPQMVAAGHWSGPTPPRRCPAYPASRSPTTPAGCWSRSC